MLCKQSCTSNAIMPMLVLALRTSTRSDNWHDAALRLSPVSFARCVAYAQSSPVVNDYAHTVKIYF